MAFYKKLTKKEKREVYKKALNELKFHIVHSYTCYLCPLLIKILKGMGKISEEATFDVAYRDLEWMLPEFIKQKPIGKEAGDPWFCVVNYSKREEVLLNCIEALKK